MTPSTSSITAVRIQVGAPRQVQFVTRAFPLAVDEEEDAGDPCTPQRLLRGRGRRRVEHDDSTLPPRPAKLSCQQLIRDFSITRRSPVKQAGTSKSPSKSPAKKRALAADDVGEDLSSFLDVSGGDQQLPEVSVQQLPLVPPAAVDLTTTTATTASSTIATPTLVVAPVRAPTSVFPVRPLDLVGFNLARRAKSDSDFCCFQRTSSSQQPPLRPRCSFNLADFAHPRAAPPMSAAEKKKHQLHLKKVQKRTAAAAAELVRLEEEELAGDIRRNPPVVLSPSVSSREEAARSLLQHGYTPATEQWLGGVFAAQSPEGRRVAAASPRQERFSSQSPIRSISALFTDTLQLETAAPDSSLARRAEPEASAQETRPALGPVSSQPVPVPVAAAAEDPAAPASSSTASAPEPAGDDTQL